MKIPARLSGRLYQAMLAASETPVTRTRESTLNKSKRWFRTGRFLGFLILIVCGVIVSVRYAPLVVGLVCGGEVFLLAGIILFRHIALAPRISGAIAREHEQGRYDLLSLTELGEIGATWLLSKPVLRIRAKARSEWTASKRVRSLTSMVAKVLLALLILISIFGFADTIRPVSAQRTSDYTFMIAGLAYLTAFAFAVRYDVEQTPTISALLGMLAPTFVRTALEAQIASIAAFVALQLGSYGIALYLISKVFQTAAFRYDAPNSVMTNPLAEITLAATYFAIFFGIREGIVWLLWRWLWRRLRADAVEFELARRVKQ